MIANIATREARTARKYNFGEKVLIYGSSLVWHITGAYHGHMSGGVYGHYIGRAQMRNIGGWCRSSFVDNNIREVL